MDFFNIPSELSKANSPAYKSGLLKLYAKGGFTGRSNYKRSIENDIRVGMYDDGGDVVTGPGPRITLPSIGPTRNDSLALFNNAVAVNDFYRRNDYSVTQERYGADPNVFTNLKSKADKVNDIARLSTRFSALGRPSLNIGTPNGRIPVEKIQYYEKIDKNKFKQRELTYGFLNTNAPMQLFDRRIVPNIFTQYESPINSPYDIAEVYSYDPISVKPWDMLAPKEKESRIEKYGVSGSPFATKKDFYASLNPPAPTPTKEIEKAIVEPVKKVPSDTPRMTGVPSNEVYYLAPGAAPIDPRTGKLNLKRLYNPDNYAGQRYDKEGNKINAQGVRMEKGGLIAFDEGGKSGDPTDEELAKKQIRYNQIISDEYKSLLGQQYINELNRVNSVIKNVIPTAKKIDSEDNKYYHNYPTEYAQFLLASNPKELELARQNLPPAIKSLLPNEGRYNIAQWDAKNNTWKSGADPSRELYCTPYGCFNYQKAGATDVPIIPGNVTFANKAEKGELPFEKINPKDRQPGDIALLVEMAPADYINNSNMVLRPHHTTIYSRPEENSSDPKKGYFYNAQGGNRLSYNESFFNLTDDSKSRIDYYRYVGKTKKIKEELDRLDTERLELKNYLDKVYENRKVPSKGISLLPQEEYSVPMSSKIPTTNFGTKLKVSSKKMSNVGFGELPNFDNYNLQTFEESPAILKKGGLQLFGKGGYRVVRTSERKGKTHKVIGPGGKVKYFGDPSMGERSKSKYGKEAFYKRHAKNLKANPYFRAYARATWSEGGIVRDVEPFNLSSY